jgi:hypothetical protein
LQKEAAAATQPISIRLTQEERSLLIQRAGDAGLSAYVRQRIFGAGRRQSFPRNPAASTRDLAHVLALLGSTELAGSLRELSYAASIGALPVLPETERAINEACLAVDEMRSALIEALGLKGGAE